jgi:hypothetical protein
MASVDREVVTMPLNVSRDGRVAFEQVHDMAKQIDLARLADPPISLRAAAVDRSSLRSGGAAAAGTMTTFRRLRPRSCSSRGLAVRE